MRLAQNFVLFTVMTPKFQIRGSHKKRVKVKIMKRNLEWFEQDSWYTELPADERVVIS